MPRCRELKDGILAKWQKTQQTFLDNLVKFRLSTVPTVIKRRSKIINTQSSVQTIENNLVIKPVTKESGTIEN
jgi:hypothetical protein